MSLAADARFHKMAFIIKGHICKEHNILYQLNGHVAFTHKLIHYRNFSAPVASNFKLKQEHCNENQIYFLMFRLQLSNSSRHKRVPTAVQHSIIKKLQHLNYDCRPIQATALSTHYQNTFAQHGIVRATERNNSVYVAFPWLPIYRFYYPLRYTTSESLRLLSKYFLDLIPIAYICQFCLLLNS